MTGRVGHQVISVFVAITILSNFSDCGYCPASAPTVSVVSKCPTNKTEWDQAASRKKCNFMTAKCEDKSPVYHCLLNQWRNETVEVCASTWYISGFCAVYNIDEMKVIDDFQTDCTKFTESKCPSRYISSEAYLYQKCYEKRDLAVTLTDKTQQEINDNKSYIAALVVVILFAIFMGIFLLLTCLGKIPIIVNGRSCKKDTDEESTRVESTSLMESNVNGRSCKKDTDEESARVESTSLMESNGTIMEADEIHNSTNDPYAPLLQNGESTSSSSNADSDEETKNNGQNKVVDNHNSTNVPYSELQKRWERTTSRSKNDCDEGTENNEQSEDLMVEVVDNHNSTNVPYSELQKRWERTASRSKSDCDEGTENKEKSEEEAKQDKVHLPQRNNVDVSQQNEVNGSQQDEVNGSQQDEVVVSKSERVDGSQQDEVNGSQQDEVVVSKSDRIDASQQIEVDVSQQNEIDVSQQNEANVSHKDEVDQPQQGCVDDSQQILPNASQQSGVNVLQRRQMFENKSRSPPS